MVLPVQVDVSGRVHLCCPASGDDPVGGLSGADLVAAFMERRVLPLQGRPHMICQMSGRFDPCRLSTKEMPHAEVLYMVNYISNCKLTEEWQYGKVPYSRANPPPVVSFSSSLSLLVPEFMVADS